MKFRKLREKLGSYDFAVAMSGTSEDAKKSRENFGKYLFEHYTLEESETPEFLDSDVPVDVLIAFAPLEGILRERKRMGLE